MTQLTLLPTNAWALDEETKRIGRTGLASAREVLAAKNAVRTIEPATAEFTAVKAGKPATTNRPIPRELVDAKHLLAA